MARLLLILALASSVTVWGQSAISAHSGMIHYVEGEVLLEGHPVDPKFGEFPEVKNDQVLQTEEGRAEVLLTPGVFLRVSENSSFRLLSGRLSDTALEMLSGAAIFEVDRLPKDNAITVRYRDVTVSLSKRGLYRFDADTERLRVYDGEAEAIYGVKKVQVHKGRHVDLDETLMATTFDVKDTDAFYDWASRRSEYLAAANILWRGAHSEPANQAPTRAQIWALVQKEVAADYAVGDPSLKILWDYGRMIETSRPQESAEVFRQLLAMQPDRAEVSIELAAALLAGGQTVEAARVLTALPRVLSSEESPRYFAVAAYVALRRGDRNQARVLAGKLMDAPKSSPTDRQQAQQLLDYLK
jgi:hypothetical protein